MEGYLGEIRMFAGDYAPRGWMFCAGQTLAMNEYPALYAVVGNAYGGDGRVVFKLPDLRGRVPLAQGQSAGTSNYFLGQMGGYEEVPIGTSNMPQHNHNVEFTLNATPQATTDANGSSTPADGDVLSKGVSTLNLTTGEAKIYSSSTSNMVDLREAPVNGNISISNSGGGTPLYNVQPFSVVNFIICVDGYFPLRN